MQFRPKEAPSAWSTVTRLHSEQSNVRPALEGHAKDGLHHPWLVPGGEAVEERGEELHPALRVSEQDARPKLRHVVKLRGPVQIERAMAIEAQRGLKPDAKNIGYHFVVDAEVPLQFVVDA